MLRLRGEDKHGPVLMYCPDLGLHKLLIQLQARIPLNALAALIEMKFSAAPGL